MVGDEGSPDRGSVLYMVSVRCLSVCTVFQKKWWERKQPFQFAAVGRCLHSDPFRVSVSVEAKSVHVAVIVNLANREQFNVCWDDNAVCLIHLPGK